MTSVSLRPRHFLWLAITVLLLAAVLRLACLHDVPPGLSQDEVLDADIAAFIRQGQHALFFREGYGHEPLYHYWAAFFQTLLGDNVLSIRLPAVYLGLLLVAATMRWARRDFGSVAAAAASVGLAISWWPIVFSRIGIRPISEPLLLVVAIWFWQRRPWLAGLCLGLSLYTYTAARVVFLIPVLYGLVQAALAPSAQARWRQLRTATVILVVTLLVYAPLFFTLRADPTLQQRLEQLSGPLEALRQGDAGPVLATTVATLGVFSFTGDPRWTYTLPGRPLFDPVTAVLFYSGLLLAFSRLRQPRYTLVLVWLGVTLLPSALSPDAPSTVRLVGALPVVYLQPGLAVAWLWSLLSSGRIAQWLKVGRTFKPEFWIILAVLLAIAGTNVARTLRDGFIRWPSELETRLRYQTVLLDIGRHWQRQPAQRLVVADAFFEPIDADSLRRNASGLPAVRWVQTGAEMGGAIVFPAGSMEEGHFYVPEFAPPAIELMSAAGLSPQPIYRSRETPSFAVYALPSVPASPSMPLAITFENAITLLGYDLLALEPGRPLQIITHWQVEAPLPWGLTTFMHLVDGSNAVITQYDGLDAAPTTLRPGDRFVQRHLLPLPAMEAGSEYALRLGLYLPGDGRRLTHSDGRVDSLTLVAGLLFDGN